MMVHEQVSANPSCYSVSGNSLQVLLEQLSGFRKTSSASCYSSVFDIARACLALSIKILPIMVKHNQFHVEHPSMRFGLHLQHCDSRGACVNLHPESACTIILWFFSLPALQSGLVSCLLSGKGVRWVGTSCSDRTSQAIQAPFPKRPWTKHPVTIAPHSYDDNGCNC